MVHHPALAQRATRSRLTSSRQFTRAKSPTYSVNLDFARLVSPLCVRRRPEGHIQMDGFGLKLPQKERR